MKGDGIRVYAGYLGSGTKGVPCKGCEMNGETPLLQWADGVSCSVAQNKHALKFRVALELRKIYRLHSEQRCSQQSAKQITT